MKFDNLSLEEKVGQKFMFGVNSSNIDCLYKLIRECKIGGVILYKKNYSSYEEMLNVIKNLKNANNTNRIPLFIAIDQEGGKVNRMPDEFKNIKNVFDLTSLKDVKLIEKSAEVTSKMLIQSGINMNFAPVLDTYNNIDNNALYKRCFSDDVDVVSRYGISYMKKLQNNNIISVIKHFPGHGSSKRDSHVFVPYVRNYKEVLEKHIIPFKKAISNGADAIMVGHLVIRKLTDGLPASISRNFINTYLRERYDYNGLVITDDIKMTAVNLFYRFDIMKKVISSSDIVLLKYNNGDDKLIHDIIRKVRNGKIDIKDINNSVDRILKIKEKYKVSDDINFVGCDIEKINRDIDLINKICDD